MEYLFNIWDNQFTGKVL